MKQYILKTDVSTHYYKDEQMEIPHREDGPAIEWANGGEAWFIDGKRHNENGPAVKYNNLRLWFIDDKRHREDGPAVIWANGRKQWFIHGVELTEEEFNNRNKES